MHSRSLVAAAACAALLGAPATSSAAQYPGAGTTSPQSPSSHGHDGWHAARRSEAHPADRSETADTAVDNFSKEFTLNGDEPGGSIARISAQSPDCELPPIPSAGPVWSYPPRRSAMSVPVPGFSGEVTAPRRHEEFGRLALRPSARDPLGLDSRSARYGAATTSDAYQSPAYESPPPLPSFHAPPFERAGPTCPVEPYPCNPCQTNPFDDPCRMLSEGAYPYSWDNIYFFAAYEAFRLDHEDVRAALRAGLNWGLPVFDDYSGLGFQIGFSGSLAEEGPQWFVTSGLFYRGDMRAESAWNVGAVFDWMHDNEIGAGIGQLRAMTSITLDRKNELGVWGAASVIDDDDKFGHRAESVDQLNLFYRYLFDSGWDISIWAGWRSPQDSAAIGATLYAPLNDYWASFTSAYYAFEGDTYNTFTGLMRHWGNRARQDYLGQNRHMPYLPVADNTSMTLFHKP